MPTTIKFHKISNKPSKIFAALYFKVTLQSTNAFLSLVPKSFLPSIIKWMWNKSSLLNNLFPITYSFIYVLLYHITRNCINWVNLNQLVFLMINQTQCRKSEKCMKNIRSISRSISKTTFFFVLTIHYVFFKLTFIHYFFISDCIYAA